MVRTGALLAAIILSSAAGRAGAQDLPGNAVEGQKLAAAHCSTCHPVDRPQQASQQAPSFTSIARMPSTTSLSLHVFLITPHANMPNYRLTANEVDDVVAYILSLHGY
jgi:mono/diheme cytochrome c family protein